MPNKTFKGHIPDKPITLTMESADGTRTETIRCVPSIPGSVLLGFFGDVTEENPAAASAAMDKLLRSAIVEADTEKFDAFISDPNNGVSLDILSEIAGWVAEQYAGGDGETTTGDPLEQGLSV